jgi:hypothetical protein
LLRLQQTKVKTTIGEKSGGKKMAGKNGGKKLKWKQIEVRVNNDR